MGVLSEVRAATHAVHQSLDDHPLLVRFMSQCDLSAYHGFLKTFQLFLECLEQYSADYIDESDRAVFQYRTWLDALHDDLSKMPRFDFHPVTELPSPSNGRSEFWGILYVMEGSILGGTQVAAAIPQEWPSTFLRRGATTRLRWPTFCRRLGELETAGVITSLGVQSGASKAFLSMIQIFDKYLDNARMVPRKVEAAYDRIASPE
ncbi:MAG: biliverdin-producing heme oxygenase [Chitinophagaceae bacterium]|nr:biliverdin-producing heme oxygenase [Oligoflexus sp.]